MSQPKATRIDFDLRARRSLKLELKGVTETMREKLERKMDQCSTRRYMPLSWQKNVRESVYGTKRPYKKGKLVITG